MSSNAHQYLIDGYNFLFRLAKSRSSLQAKRLEFIEKLESLVSSLHLNATVVFDSADPSARLPTRGHFDALEIVYTTRELSADAFSLEKIESAMHPERIIVVTSDRDLAASCKALNAKTLSVEAFVAFLTKKKKSEKKKTVRTRPSRDSDAEIDRLLKIFEKRLENLN